MATIESLVIKITGESKSLEGAVSRARKALDSLGIKTTFITDGLQLFKRTFIDAVKAEGLTRLRDTLTDFIADVRKGILPELQRLGESIQNFFLVDEAKGAIKEFRDTTIKSLNDIIIKLTEFLQKVTIKDVFDGFKSIAQDLRDIADTFREIGVFIGNIKTGFGLFGDAPAPSPRDGGVQGLDASKITGGVTQSDLLQESQRTNDILRNLKLQNVLG